MCDRSRTDLCWRRSAWRPSQSDGPADRSGVADPRIAGRRPTRARRAIARTHGVRRRRAGKDRERRPPDNGRGLRGTGLTAELTGAPVMQLEIRHALKRDRIDGGGRIVGLALPRSGLSSCRSVQRARGRAAFSGASRAQPALFRLPSSFRSSSLRAFVMISAVSRRCLAIASVAAALSRAMAASKIRLCSADTLRSRPTTPE